MKRTIHLYGELAEKFTNKITLDASSLYEAISGLRANFKGFEKYLVEHTPGFHVRIGNIYRSEETIHDPIGSNNDIHLVPAITGSGGKVGAIFAIIIGVVLLFTPVGPAIAGMLGSMGSTIVTSFAVGLVMSGISALLYSAPKTDQKERPENTPNTYFSGAVNTIAQGHPVPIGYGELIIGSAVISAGLESVNIE